MIDTKQDPLDEVSAARRWALLGTLGAVFALVPIYGVALGLSVAETAFVLLPAAAIALAGVELTSRWEYGMHRRYAYPHHLGCELASIHEFPRACQRSADLVSHWLRARAVVVAWLSDDGEALAPVAACGLPDGWVEHAPRMSVGFRAMKEMLEKGHILAQASTKGDPWFEAGFRNQRVVYVPLLSRDRPQGVLALVAPASNHHIRDEQLLAALGLVLGLALDNCRLYEGQRAHTQHLQELNRMKSDFLSTVSHELRTPLTSIMLAAEMLLEEEETQDPESIHVRLVRNIVKGASRLSGLVSDLVNVAREDEFKPRLELDPVPIEDVVANAVGIIQPLVAAKHQSVEVKLHTPDTVVRLDRLRFEQVLINLLSNAQRYSPPGGHIFVSSRAERDEIIISVTDSGPGVAPEDRELIFEPFHRGDRSGLGLGLAIAKSLVELHNGRIWVESSNGHGSAFNVALPAHSKTGSRPLATPGSPVSR
jgi:signal transduction histidine kinase